MKPGPGRVAQVRSIAERVAGGFGLDVFDVQLRRESAGWLLRIVLDRPAAADGGTAGEAGGVADRAGGVADRAGGVAGGTGGVADGTGGVAGGAGGAADEPVTLDDCQRVSTDVSVVLDVEFDFEHPYTLEVSSPGLDRPLRHPGDCRRFRGRLARFVTSEAVDGQRFLRGRIAGVEPAGGGTPEAQRRVVVRAGRRVHRIPWALVTRARLEVEP